MFEVSSSCNLSESFGEVFGAGVGSFEGGLWLVLAREVCVDVAAGSPFRGGVFVNTVRDGGTMMADLAALRK